jgi:uncharacterized repeat protein (TIGR03943 family)
MTLSRRTLRLLVLSAWAGCLLLLWLTGGTGQYLGTRTAWVVPFGGITLTIATVLYALFSAEGAAARTGVTRTEALGLVALVLPVLVAFTLADAALGSLAASRKLSTRGLDLTQLIGNKAAAGGETSFASLDAAQEHPSQAADYSAQPGALVKLQGFVLQPPAHRGDSFRLARMFITCCVADSIALSARVLPPASAPAYGKDTWLEVDGAVAGRGRALRIRALRVTEIPKPRQPYESFSG